MRLSLSQHLLAAGLFALPFLLAAAPAHVAFAQERGRAEIDVENEIAKIAKDYAIDIVVRDAKFPVRCSYGVIDGEPAKEMACEKYAALFAREFSLYPVELIRKSRLARVVFCEELYFAKQRRTAIPDFEHDTLYLDVSRGMERKHYLSKVLHHEFFHILDKQDDGELYRDERWAALNPSGVKYGDGGKNAQGNSATSTLTESYAGFLNHYSTTGVEEDKAEIFANMVVEPDYVAERAKADQVLESKTKLMQELLKAFTPEMDEAFWERVKTAPRQAPKH